MIHLVLKNLIFKEMNKPVNKIKNNFHSHDMEMKYYEDLSDEEFEKVQEERESLLEM